MGRGGVAPSLTSHVARKLCDEAEVHNILAQIERVFHRDEDPTISRNSSRLTLEDSHYTYATRIC